VGGLVRAMRQRLPFPRPATTPPVADTSADEVRAEMAGMSIAQRETMTVVAEQIAMNEQLRARLSDLEWRLEATHVAAEVLATVSWIRRSDVDSDALVSVIMPTLDRRAYLERAIESVRCQSHQRLEIVVVDDGSTDSTQEYLAGIDDHRVRVLCHDSNLGAAAARNTGLDHASGDLIVHLDSDNFFDPDWVRSVVWAFTSFPERHHLYGVRVFDDIVRAHDPSKRGLPSLQLLPWDTEAVRQNNRVDMNVLAHRRTPLRFDVETWTFEDWDFLLQLMERYGEPLRLPALAAYYTTDAPNRMMQRDPDQIVESMERVRQRWERRDR